MMELSWSQQDFPTPIYTRLEQLLSPTPPEVFFTQRSEDLARTHRFNTQADYFDFIVMETIHEFNDRELDFLWFRENVAREKEPGIIAA